MSHDKPTQVQQVCQSDLLEARPSEDREQRDRNRQLQGEIDLLKLDNHKQAVLLASAERLVRDLEQGFQSLRDSLSMRVGFLVMNSLRSVRGVLSLPFRLLRLVGSLRDRGDGSIVYPVRIPEHWFSAEVRAELGRFYQDLERADPKALQKVRGPEGRQGASTRFAELPRQLAEVRMAAIMDQFTYSAFSECCQVTQLTAEEWRREIAAARPHLLFIESAWEGKNNSWQRKISHGSPELQALTSYCRSVGIPVVFWSKEDPVHFRTFLPVARMADVVFTTDIDCVQHYRRELGHQRCYLLPFATQPSAHNPIEQYERKRGFCFAGSYYLRYPVRQRDFAELIDATSKLEAVDIYDRNFGKEHPNYLFPERYKPLIVGGLPFDQIDLAYKGYDFGININTVKHSQSMFARRVFDLIASNTVVVSNYSRGLRLMFGDLVVASDNAGELERRLLPLLQDPAKRRRHRLVGLRKVLLQHTYDRRLAFVLEKTFGHAPATREHRIVVLARAGNDDELDALLAAFRRQSWPNKRLVLTFRNGYQPELSPVGEDVEVLSSRSAEAITIEAVAGSARVTALRVDDYYGVNYLTDLALGFAYAGMPSVGKVAHYAMVDGVIRIHADGAQYRPSPVATLGRCMFADASSLASMSVSSFLDGVSEGKNLAVECLALDEFNYCSGAALTDCADLDVDQLTDVDPGMDIDQLMALVDRTNRSDAATATGSINDASEGLPGLDATALSAGLGALPSTYLTAALESSDLVIRSTLPKHKHVYSYLPDELAPSAMQMTDIARLNLVVDRSEGLDLVLVYKHVDGGKISHSIVRSGSNVTVTVPPGTHSVQVGIKITGSGDFRIRRLAFAHVPLSVDAIVPRSRSLLLAKNYPSYEDLYKHAFVHKRVVEYRRLGSDVDVFRLGKDGLSFYEFEGIDVISGQADHLRAMLRSGDYDNVLVHFLDEKMWEVLQEFVSRVRVFVWVHGAEIQSASRRRFDHVDEATSRRAEALGERRMQFWRRIFAEDHPNLRLIFVSEWFARDVMEDVGVRLDPSRYHVIHNFIDTDLFAFSPKPDEQRMNVLSIRPFESAKYANDLSVATVLALRDKPYFSRLRFHFVGDGRLFDETVAPLAGLDNVIVQRRFMRQGEIAALHRNYGVFLCPTRMDAQGVSRDEAMSSGLVPVTTRITAVPEFVDDDSGILAPPEDVQELANAIDRLYSNPELFQQLSKAASARVKQQSGLDSTIRREVALFDRRKAG
jgi:glycosyltransferase involved in cell wall biosynthesis/spore maturation protein CgeB